MNWRTASEAVSLRNLSSYVIDDDRSREYIILRAERVKRPAMITDGTATGGLLS